MIREMREKLGREIDQLSHELNILLPQAIAQAVELGDLRENSEYKAALERQQFVQARLGQLHQRLNQLSQLANAEAPTLGRALGGGKVGEEVSLRLPTAMRRLRIIDLVTVHQAEGNGGNGKR